MSDDDEVPQRTDELLALLVRAGVEHVVIGGVAAIAWGGAELTRDLDIVMPFDVDHVTRLMDAFAPYGNEHELVDIDDLIAIKEHVARPKDLIVAAQLRAIRTRLPPRGG